MPYHILTVLSGGGGFVQEMESCGEVQEEHVWVLEAEDSFQGPELLYL